MMRLLPSLSTVARPPHYRYSYSLALHLITLSSSSSRLLHPGASSVAAMTTQQQPQPPPSTPTSQRLARTIVDVISDGDGTRPRPRPPPPRICLAIAGGGSGSISSLASTPGASAALVEGTVLYDRNSFANYLRENRSGGAVSTEGRGGAGASSTSFVSREAAVDLARCALHKCMRCTPRISTAVTVGADGSGGEGGAATAVVEIERGMDTCIGVGCTSALATARPRRGGHVCHVALADASSSGGTMVRLHDLILTKGARSRGEEEEVVSSVVLLAVLRYLREGRRKVDGGDGGGSDDDDEDDVLGGVIASATGEVLMEGERIEEETLVQHSRFRAGRGEEGEAQVTSTDDAEDAPPPHSPPSSSAFSMAGARDGAERVIRGEGRAVMVVPTFLRRQEEVGSLSPPSSPRGGISAGGKGVSMTALAAHPVILPPDAVVFPGSFNPIHGGHVALANAATNALRRIRRREEDDDGDSVGDGGDGGSKERPVSVVFEMSLTNADKLPMEADEAVRRLSHFAAMVADPTAGDDADGDDAGGGAMTMPDDWAVLLTAAPLFSQKVDILADCVAGADAGRRRRLAFVIGTDTMVRILNPKYYGGGSHDAMMGAVRDMGRRGVHFIVGGRLDQQGGEGSGEFVSGSEELSSLPPDVRDMFTLLGEDEFRADVSSTELRRRAAAAATAGKGSSEKR